MAIIEICKKYKADRREYRSKVSVFGFGTNPYFPTSVITPYDGQRSLIERMLKDEKMEWADRCFNVDSFQGVVESLHLMGSGLSVLLSGNEADNIIISLVRSRGLGFLDNERRMNVMLSRCRQSMLICSSRNYLSLPAVRGTLVGDVSLCHWLLITLLILFHSLHQGVRQSIKRSHGSAWIMSGSGCGNK